jgi:aspartyl-tRNA synthetase
MIEVSNERKVVKSPFRTIPQQSEDLVRKRLFANSMTRTYIKELKAKVGEQVLIKGFVQTIRNQGSIKFLMLRDVTGVIQVVVLKSEADAAQVANELTLESVVEISGLAKEEKQAPGGYEVQAQKIIILSKAEPELPIPVLSEKGGEETEQTKRFDWRWLDLRKSEKLQIFKIWTELETGARKYFLANNFLQIYTPSFMSTASESGADLFEVKYFEKKAYLSQSPQFYKQMAMAAGFEKVFMVGPVYRAEPSYTTRHVTEFTGWDFEVSYIDSHFELMAIEEQMLIAGFSQVKDALGLDITVPTAPFPKITMAEAKVKLKAAGIPSEKDYDISSEEEKALGDIIKKETGHDFVFVTDWPIAGRPFYHMRYADSPGITKSADLLYKGLEITTLAQREHRIAVLEKQALEKGLSLESLTDYLNFFRYGCPPHGGAGIGPARIVMKLLDQPSIKEVIYLPRDVKRLRP